MVTTKDLVQTVNKHYAPYALNSCSCKSSTVAIALSNKGYVDDVVHEPLLEVVDDGCLRNLLEQHHVVDTAGLDIVALPVVRLK